MKEYKGYTIEQITRRDWMVKDGNGETVRTEDDRPTTRTLKEAKEMIDRITEENGMNNLKEAFKAFEEAEEKHNKIDEAYEADPENEEIEKAWDEAYEEWWKARDILVNEIEKLTKGAIERTIINGMLATKRNEIRALIERTA